MDTPGKRLRAVMKHFRLTQQALGERIGVTKGYLSVMMNDKEPISTKVLDGLIKSFAGLNSHWLLTGEGEMFFEKKDVVLAPPEAGLLTGVMEPEDVRYERLPRNGIFEEALHRIEVLEDRVAELEEELRRVKEGRG